MCQSVPSLREELAEYEDSNPLSYYVLCKQFICIASSTLNLALFPVALSSFPLLGKTGALLLL
jgi:hypothetical protein